MSLTDNCTFCAPSPPPDAEVCLQLVFRDSVLFDDRNWLGLEISIYAVDSVGQGNERQRIWFDRLRLTGLDTTDGAGVKDLREAVAFRPSVTQAMTVEQVAAVERVDPRLWNEDLGEWTQLRSFASDGAAIRDAIARFDAYVRVVAPIARALCAAVKAWKEAEP